MKKFLAAVAIGASLVLTVGAAPALADPPNDRALDGTGSDTTQEVMDALSNVVVGDEDGDPVTPDVLVLGNYGVTGGPITTNAQPGCTAMARPNGSGAGRDALAASVGGVPAAVGTPIAGQSYGSVAEECLDFARSSSGPGGTFAPGVSLTWVPFATDVVTYGYRQGGSVPKNLSFAQLQSAYKCDGLAIPVGAVNPLLPQSGSGTRSYWIGQMGITDAAIPSCVSDKGNTVQEHNGTFVTGAREIVPFSVAQFISSQTGTTTNPLGLIRLGSIGGVEPIVANASLRTNRLVYNIVPTNDLGAGTLTSQVFSGTSSRLCGAAATIADYGFAPLTASSGAGSCGDITRVRP